MSRAPTRPALSRRASNLAGVDFAVEFVDQNRTFVDRALAADLDTAVPTCPGWTLKQVVRHVGGGDRWAAQIVGDRMTGPLEFGDIRDARAPADPAAARHWLRAGAQLLVDAVADADGTEVWTFEGPRPAGWWLRRRLHETLVHNADVAIAVGARFEPTASVAADAISEWLDLATARADLSGASLHLHATDDELGEHGEWTVAEGTWSHRHAKGDVALRGPAADLLLALTRRRAIEDTAIELFGDTGRWQSWLDSTPF